MFVMILFIWCLLVTITPTSADDIPSYEIDALHDFYDSTNGTYWIKYPGVWDFTDPQPCTDNWVGIWCNVDHTHITELQLSEMSLMGTLPPSLGNLSELAQLVLKGNPHLVGTIPVELSKLKKLEILTLNQNGLNGTIPTFLSDQSGLAQLNLGTCHFHGTIPSELSKLTKMRWLDLSSNQLTGTIPPELGDLELLQEMVIYSMSGIVGTIPPEFCKLRKLELLLLDSNRMTGTLPDCIGDWTSIEQIDIANNLFNGTIPNSITSYEKGYYLYLGQNYFTGTIPKLLGNLTQLRQLNAYGNRLNGSIPNLDNVVHLTMLYLSSNELTGSIPVGLCNATGLSSVDLSYNFLSHHIPSCLFSNTSLNVIYLMNNLLTGPLPTKYNDAVILQSIQLQNNLLSQQLPPEIFNTTLNVYSLYLCGNQLTGSIPDEVRDLDQVVELDLHNNHLTGVIPDLSALSVMNILALDGNYFSQEIPTTLGSLTQLQSLFLFNNHLTGFIPAQIASIRALTILALNDNHLSGSIPSVVSQMNNLDIFFVFGNSLTGTLDRVFDSSIQTRLKYVDVSKNQLSGNLPNELFHVRSLQSFTAVSNCFTGSIPSQICQCGNLSTLALDGLMSASSCQMRFFPSWTSSYGLPNSIKGGLPHCLFSMPHLLSLHLSGNGLTGSLPSDLIISETLHDLSLSHNNLRGAIPSQLQLHNWTNLDLSYNKFRGTVDPSIFSFDSSVHGSNGSLSLQVNRLSGVIPASLHAAPHVSMLDGNLYECDVSRTDLPEHDPYRDIYECGSNSFNYALYFWLLVVVCVGGTMGLVACWLANSSSGSKAGGVVSGIRDNVATWLSVFSPAGPFSGLHAPAQPRLSHVLSFGQFVASFRRQTLKLSAFIVFVCLPVYLILSSFYDTYTYEYAWTASGCYLSGVVPAVIMLLLFALFGAGAVHCMRRMASTTNDDAIDDKEEVHAPPNSDAVKIIDDDTPAQWTYSEYAQVSLLVLFNLVLVTAVNIGYVYVDHNYSSGVVRATQISVALFKILWKNWIVRLLLRYSHHVTSSNTTELKKKQAGPDLSLAVFVTIFNNIAAPFIATCYVSSDCFYNVVSSPPKVKVSYEYLSCLYGSFNDNVTTCYTFDNMKLTETSYDPPFVYSFQCSSTFVSTYSSVYVLLLTFEAFAVPLVMWLLAGCHSRVVRWRERGRLMRQLEKAIPRILQSLDDDESIALMKTAQTYDSEQAPYFECAVFVVKLVNMFSLLCTFGVVLPPVAVVCCVAVLSASVNMQLFIGRLISNAIGSTSVRSEVKLVDADCQHSSQMFLGSPWTLIPFVCIFFAIILFDTLGDSVGWRQALWAPVLLLAGPVMLWCTQKVGRRYRYSVMDNCCSSNISDGPSRRRRISGSRRESGEEVRRHVSDSGVLYSHSTDYSPLRVIEDEAVSKALIPCEDAESMNTKL